MRKYINKFTISKHIIFFDIANIQQTYAKPKHIF